MENATFVCCLDNVCMAMLKQYNYSSRSGNYAWIMAVIANFEERTQVGMPSNLFTFLGWVQVWIRMEIFWRSNKPN